MEPARFTGVSSPRGSFLDVDRELALRLRLGTRDEQALAELIDLTAPHIRRAAMSLLGDPDEAEDVVLETFTLFWTRIELFRNGSGPFVPWLLRVARNRGIDRLRARQRRRMLGSRLATATSTGRPHSAVTQPDDSRHGLWPLQDQVGPALAMLPAEQRTAVHLAYFDGLTHTEIARRLNVPLGTVKTRIWRAIARLRVALCADSRSAAPP